MNDQKAIRQQQVLYKSRESRPTNIVKYGMKKGKVPPHTSWQQASRSIQVQPG